MATELANLQTKVSSLLEFKMEAGPKIYSLEGRVRSLSTSLHNYKLVRGRFISSFKRDILKTATDADTEITCDGKTWAIADAQLYEDPAGQRDNVAYKMLYGSDPL